MSIIVVSVSRAHKAAERLASRIAGLRKEITARLMPSRMQGFGGENQVRSFQKAVTQAGGDMAEVRRLSHAYFNIRIAIGAENTKHQVDELLAKIEFLRRELSVTHDLLQAYTDPAIVHFTELADYRALSENQAYARETGVLVGKLGINDITLLRENAETFNRDMAVLQDKLAEINATSRVSLDVPDDIAVSIGLIPPASS